MEQAAGQELAGPGSLAFCGFPGEWREGWGRGQHDRWRENSLCACCPDRPLVLSAVLLLCGPFWALFREMAGVPGGHCV